MKCCTNCFKDSELSAMIENSPLGKCDFCTSDDKPTIDISTTLTLNDSFNSIIDIYQSTIDDSSSDTLIHHILVNDWDIFNNFTPEQVEMFLKEIIAERLEFDPNFFSKHWAIPTEMYKENSLIIFDKWNDLINQIRDINRFHTNAFNEPLFEKIFDRLKIIVSTESVFYRARVWIDKEGYDKKSMGAPPSSKACAGRANPEGISYLYLCDSKETTLHETRAALYDSVTIGEFKLIEEIKELQIIDLTILESMSPFHYENIPLYAANRKHFIDMVKSISKPQRRFDSALDYLPTQYLCDYLKSKNYDGIKYNSVMHQSGINYTIFSIDALECVDVTHVEVSEIHYKSEPAPLLSN